MCLQGNSHDAHNNEYRKVIQGLEECMKEVGVVLDALQKHRNRLKVQFWKESKDWKKFEQALDKAKKTLKSTKGQLACTEQANIGLYKQIQRLE